MGECSFQVGILWQPLQFFSFLSSCLKKFYLIVAVSDHLYTWVQGNRANDVKQVWTSVGNCSEHLITVENQRDEHEYQGIEEFCLRWEKIWILLQRQFILTQDQICIIDRIILPLWVIWLNKSLYRHHRTTMNRGQRSTQGSVMQQWTLLLKSYNLFSSCIF